MTLEDNKKLARRFYEEIVNTGDVDRIEELVAPGYTEVHGGQRHSVGPEGAKAHITGVREAYENLTVTINRQIAEGDWVVSCITATGIHKGIWHDMICTNEPVTFTGVNVDRVKDGKIVEHGGAADMLGPLLEIGAVKVVKSDETDD